MIELVTAGLVAVVGVLWIVLLVHFMAKPLWFDDGYMFYRYALNVRHGLGLSWNLDGVHTYGETALLWGLCILVLSYLPLSIPTTLIFASWLSSAAALFALAWAVARNARSPLLRSPWRMLPLVALSLTATSQIFLLNSVTGMETMLATALLAWYAGLCLRVTTGAPVRPVLTALVGVLALLTRPEAALTVLGLPLLLALLYPDRSADRGVRRSLVLLVTLLVLGIALDLTMCKLYFGTPVPLSFYMKSRHAYLGYTKSWVPVDSLFKALGCCVLPLAALVLFTRRQNSRLLLACLIPLALTFAYLCTVTQIMGDSGRYYIPYLPLLIIPAMLVLDERFSGRRSADLPSLAHPAAALAFRGVLLAALLGVLYFLPTSALRAMNHALEHRNIAYDSVSLETAALRPLPEFQPYRLYAGVARTFAAGLPPGSSLAASEVGMVGAYAPQVNIIDLAGLNDPEIALHGFSMSELLARKPDIIWMPHADYTYQRGKMLADPQLLQQYDVLADAANFGLAIRKDTPFRAAIDRQLQLLWDEFYPGLRMNDYLVHSASWGGKAHPYTGD